MLPEGWLGKCHACHVGASAATGDWILFTDADCWLKPDVIARAVRVAERDGADHVTMAAGTVLESTAARAWYLLFLTGSQAGWLELTATGRNHTSASALSIWCALRPIGNAAATKRCASRWWTTSNSACSCAAPATHARLSRRDDVECHWGKTVGSMVKIMEKNYFAAIDYRLGQVLAFSVAVVLVFTILVLGLFSAPPPDPHRIAPCSRPFYRPSSWRGAWSGRGLARSLCRLCSPCSLRAAQLHLCDLAQRRHPLARNVLSAGRFAGGKCSVIDLRRPNVIPKSSSWWFRRNRHFKRSSTTVVTIVTPEDPILVPKKNLGIPCLGSSLNGEAFYESINVCARSISRVNTDRFYRETGLSHRWQGRKVGRGVLTAPRNRKSVLNVSRLTPAR